MAEYSDKDRFLLIKKEILRYKEKEKNLNKLVISLESILDSISKGKFHDCLYEMVCEIEIINAICIDEKRNILTAYEKEDVEKLLKEILNKINDISPLDFLRLNLLIKVVEEFKSGNKNYKLVAYEIRSLLDLLENIDASKIEKLEKAWGYIKLISEEAVAEEMECLEGQWKKDFLRGLNIIREVSKTELFMESTKQISTKKNNNGQG